MNPNPFASLNHFTVPVSKTVPPKNVLAQPRQQGPNRPEPLPYHNRYDNRYNNYYPFDRLVIGIRRSFPRARGVILTPGGAWRRLYSLRSTSVTTRRATSSGYPAATISGTLFSSSTYIFRIGSRRSYSGRESESFWSVSYTHLRAHETKANLVCRLLLEKK